VTEPQTTTRARWTSWLALALAAVPALSMAMFVRGASRLQWNDYWDILPRVTNPDGSFAPRGALELQNEHPVAIPSAIYWLNAKLTGGSNNALGLYVLLVVLATLFVLVRALPAALRREPTLGLGFTILVAALLFATRTIHNFVLAMSGTAWLTANALACAAFFVAWRRHPFWALPLAAAAGLSYGTGLVTFPILVAMALVQRRPRHVVVTLGAATIVAAGLYLSQYEAPQWVPGGGRTVLEVTRRTLQVLGSPFFDGGDIVTLAGVLLVCLGTIAVLRVHRDGSLLELAPWIGLLAYGVGSALLIGWSRGGLGDEVGSSSRYTSLGALAWLATLVLLAATSRRRPTEWLPVLAFVSLMAFVAGQGTVHQVVDTRYYSNQLAVALRVGARPTELDRRFNVAAIPALEALDHYPFNDDYDFDCGLTGQRLDPTRLGGTTPLSGPPGVHGELERLGSTRYVGGVELVGWFASEIGAPRCVVLIDERHEVIGAAIRAQTRAAELVAGYDAAVLLVGVARPEPGGGTYRAVAVYDGERVLLDGEVEQT
jgi:hypothetical protein